MDAEKRKELKMQAAMEGEAAIVSSIGKRVSLTEMELICLVNFAEVGMMSIFAGLDGPSGEQAEKSLEEHLDRIREEFGKDGRDGLNRLATSTGAMLRSERFFKYIA